MNKNIKIKKHINILGFFAALMIFFSASLAAQATPLTLWDDYTIPSTRQKDRLLDNADLLSSYDEEQLLAKLDSLSEKEKCNVVILTVDSHSGNIESFADDYFDYNGFGADYNNAGVLFVLSMNTREWAVSTSGAGIKAFTDYGQDVMTEMMLPYLKNGDYRGAFDVYIQRAEYYLDLYHAGTPFDVKSNRNSPLHFQLSILIGLLTGLIPIGAMASKLTPVHINTSASEYRSHNGINMRVHTDDHVDTHLSKTRKSQESYSSSSSRSHHYSSHSSSSRRHYSGGSSVHRSSSGRSHGGSHGRF